MTTVIIIIVVAGLIYSWYFYKKQSNENADAANRNRDLVINAAEQLDEKTNLAALLAMTLIRIHGAKKAATIYYNMLQNNRSDMVTPSKVALFKKYNLPEQYANYSHLLYTIQAKYGDKWGDKWNEDDASKKLEKYDKMFLRSLTSEFENIEDEMKADEEKLREIEKESSKYY